MLSLIRRGPRSFGHLPNPYRSSSGNASRLLAATRTMSVYHGESALRPEPDKVLKDIADYVHNYKVTSDLAFETARLCLIDTIGCGLEGLRFEGCSRLLGPVVEGTVVPNGTSRTPPDKKHRLTPCVGTKVPGTSYQLDPIRGAFNIGTMIRYLDFNDCFLAAECESLYPALR